MEQIRIYRDRFLPETPAYPILFGRRPEAKQQPWDERITWELDNEITVLGC